MDPERDSQPPVLASNHAAGLTAGAMQTSNLTASPSRFSSLAIVSLVAGFLSPIFIIACFLSLITSTVAIVTGHIALYKIKRSKNLDGRAVAIVGVVLGYISMALTIAFIAFIFTRPASNANSSTFANAQNSPQGRLDSAELSVLSGSKESIGSGNSELARSIATSFAQEMKRADEMVFTTNRKPGIQMSGGEYRTYCELHEDSCAFIVHVPSYRHFTKDAEQALNSIVWLTALVSVKDHLKNGDSLAVGLRGTLTYGDILVGTVTDDPKVLDNRLGSAKDLVRFFKTEQQPQLDLRQANSPIQSFEFPSESANKTTERSPFDPPEPSPSEPSVFEAAVSETVNAEPAKPEPSTSQPSEPVLSKTEGTSKTPKPAATSTATIAPKPNPKPKAKSSPKPKREVPAFENKIPVSLIASIDAQGWNIQSMIFNRNGDRLITGGLDQTVSVFDIRSGGMLFRSKRQEELGQVVSLALSKDGRTIFAGGSTGRVASYEIHDDGQVNVVKSLYKHNRDVGCIVVSPTFPFVLSGGEDGTVTWQPYDERSSSLKVVQELKRKVLAAHLFSNRNEGIATDGQSLIRFSIKDSKVLDQQKLGNAYPQAAAISPDGNRCAASYGSDLKLFGTATGEQTEKAFASSEMVWSVIFHPTKPWLVTGGNGKAIIWNVDSAERLAVLDAGSIQYVTNLAITADGNSLALIPSSAGQSIRVFDLTK